MYQVSTTDLFQYVGWSPFFQRTLSDPAWKQSRNIVFRHKFNIETLILSLEYIHMAFVNVCLLPYLWQETCSRLASHGARSPKGTQWFLNMSPKWKNMATRIREMSTFCFTLAFGKDMSPEVRSTLQTVAAGHSSFSRVFTEATETTRRSRSFPPIQRQLSDCMPSVL